MLLDPRNGPDWDECGALLKRTYVVLAPPRTASTLLCRTLWDTGRAAAPKEYCNPMQLADWSTRQGVAVPHGDLMRIAWERTRSAKMKHDHLQHVIAHRTSRDGLFGIKLQPAQVVRWFGDAAGVERRLGPVTWICIHRLDRAAHVASWQRALATGQWTAHSPRTRQLYVPQALVHRLLDQRIEQMQDWMSDRPHVVLTTESIRRDLHSNLRTVLGALHLDVTGVMPQPALTPQTPVR